MPGDKYTYKGVKRKKVKATPSTDGKEKPKKPKVYGWRYGTLNQLGPWKMLDSEATMRKQAIQVLKDHQTGFSEFFEPAGKIRIQSTIDDIAGMTTLTLDDSALTPRRFEVLIDSDRNIWCAVEFKKIKPPAEQQLTILK